MSIINEKEVDAAAPSPRSTFKAEALGTRMALLPAVGPSQAAMPASLTVAGAMLLLPITAGLNVRPPFVAAIKSFGLLNVH